MTTKKLHCLTRSKHLEMLALAEMPKNIDEEARSQKPADVEARGLRVGGQRDQVQSLN